MRSISMSLGGSCRGRCRGFGRLWRKRYRIPLTGSPVKPEEVVAVWKRHYPDFWPPGNRFFSGITELGPGDVALINSTQGGIELSTGVMVVYADAESFSFMTAEGHPFAGWITFSAVEDGGVTAAQVEVLLRSGDPLYDVLFGLFASRQEDRFWRHTLTALAGHFEVSADIERDMECVDPSRLWRNAGNVWRNAGIRSALHTMAHPVSEVRRRRAHHRTLP